MRLLQQSIRLALTSSLSSSFIASFPSSTTALFSIMTGTTTKNAPTVVAARTALEESGKSGEFIRKDSVYRNFISKGMSLALVV